MSDDILDLEAFRARRAAAREVAEVEARPVLRVYLDADGDVALDIDRVDAIIAWPADVAVDLGLYIVSIADPELFRQIGAALARDRARRIRAERRIERRKPARPTDNG